ncbi:MAG: DUF4431 domain-containing protein [Luteolibacter sp.]
MKTILQWSGAVVVACAMSSLARGDEQQKPYRDVIELSGKLEARMIPLVRENTGPDAHREKRYFLILDQPISVATPPNGDKTMYPDEKDVKELQLMSGAAPDRAVAIESRLQEAVAKNLTIRISGSLFHSSTSQHYTPVLMEIVNITLPTPVVTVPVVPAPEPEPAK